MFELKFSTDNDAFAGNREAEVQRILAVIAYQVDQGRIYGAAYDANGNRIGSWFMSEIEDNEDHESDCY